MRSTSFGAILEGELEKWNLKGGVRVARLLALLLDGGLEGQVGETLVSAMRRVARLERIGVRNSIMD